MTKNLASKDEWPNLRVTQFPANYLPVDVEIDSLVGGHLSHHGVQDLTGVA